MKLTVAIACFLFATSFARDVVFNEAPCVDKNETNKLSNSKGSKIKIMTEKNHACPSVNATIEIEKGDLSFYVKVGNYDVSRVGS